ncbi:MAG: class I SAM-dependent methyltransferase, partial [Rhizobiales bacterium]|nr:class I SAM-dependent methyltransferase [Hyphomicrobiales bacterium]
MYNYRGRTLKNFRRIAAAWRAESDLERVVAAYSGRVANKWKHYYPIYGRHFGHLRGRPCKIFEIGVADGGSLALWRKYFGAAAQITGLDINPETKRCEENGTAIYIGDQGDGDLLKQIAAERGPFDLVIEDGSHLFHHQILAFETLFAHLNDGGIYACEDLHTSYLADGEYDGGVGKPGTFA